MTTEELQKLDEFKQKLVTLSESIAELQRDRAELHARATTAELHAANLRAQVERQAVLLSGCGLAMALRDSRIGTQVVRS